MTNPITHNGLFDTPTSTDDLFEWCLRHTGGERVAALTAAAMALNLAHYLVDKEITKQHNTTTDWR